MQSLFEKDWAEWDAAHPDRDRGAGERTGRIGGLVSGIFAAPHVGRAVGHVLLRRGIRRAPAIGAGLVAAYGAIRGGQAAGGYVGRKVDETLGHVFKDWAEFDAARVTGGQKPARHADLMARAKDLQARSGKALKDPNAQRRVAGIVGRFLRKGSVEQTMGEYKRGKLRSGSKHGPKVTSRAQAIAIAMSQAGLSNK